MGEVSVLQIAAAELQAAYLEGKISNYKDIESIIENYAGHLPIY